MTTARRQWVNLFDAWYKRGKTPGTQVQHNLTSGDRGAEIRRRCVFEKRNKA